MWLSFFLVEIIHILCTKQLRFYYVSVRSVTCNRNIFLAFPQISLKLFLLDTEQSMGKFRISFCNLPHLGNKLLVASRIPVCQLFSQVRTSERTVDPRCIMGYRNNPPLDKRRPSSLFEAFLQSQHKARLCFSFIKESLRVTWTSVLFHRQTLHQYYQTKIFSVNTDKLAFSGTL